MRWRSVLLLTIIVVSILVLISFHLQCRNFVSDLSSKKPWFHPVLLTLCGLLFLLVVFYNPFISRSCIPFFPLFFLACIGLNFLWLGAMGKDAHCHLQRLHENSLPSLLQVCYNRLGNLPVYVYIHNNFKGKSLVLPTTMPNNLSLSATKMQAWGRLSKVAIREYQPKISLQDASQLLRLRHTEVEVDNGSKYIFITEAIKPVDVLCIKSQNDQIFIGPIELLSMERGVNK